MVGFIFSLLCLALGVPVDLVENECDLPHDEGHQWISLLQRRSAKMALLDALSNNSELDGSRSAGKVLLDSPSNNSEMDSNMTSLEEEHTHIVTHSVEFINSMDILIVIFVLACFGIGCIIDTKLPDTEGHPSAKVVAVLVSSYLLLIPGLFSTLFTFLIKVVINGHEVDTTAVLKRPGGLNESMISLCYMLFDTGGTVGGVLIILYAMVVPVLKLTLLTIGELWRHSNDTMKVQRARWCMVGVQLVYMFLFHDIAADSLILHLFSDFTQHR
eukprot:TRINITY_DN98625_c0_g1_i1.p1 TRINITY_DN98625_c0_g1~~TRINITY_DN98625_c0_g1_i1.p1  ORF type:complete len:272 (+),score=39.14 TRINITY_DN98625_c0_g1_i1:101-916(+)